MKTVQWDKEKLEFTAQEYQLCQVVQNLSFSCQKFNVETFAWHYILLEARGWIENSSY